MRKLIVSLAVLFVATTAFSQEVIHLDSVSFKKNVWDYNKNKEWKYEGKKVAVIDFYADWCGPCKMIAPHLEELQKEYGDKVQVYKVDTDKYPKLANLFAIRGIPTLIITPKVGEFKKVVGYRSKEQLKTEIDGLMN